MSANDPNSTYSEPPPPRYPAHPIMIYRLPCKTVPVQIHCFDMCRHRVDLGRRPHLPRIEFSGQKADIQTKSSSRLRKACPVSFFFFRWQWNCTSNMAVERADS